MVFLWGMSPCWFQVRGHSIRLWAHPNRMQGWGSVCWLVIGITLPENKEIGKFSFQVFDRNEIHIRAFVDFINGKFISGHSSSSTFHDFKILSFLIIKNAGILNFGNPENGQLMFPRFRNFRVLDFHKNVSPYFPGCSLICSYFWKYPGLIKWRNTGFQNQQYQ